MEVAIKRIRPNSLVRILNGWKVGLSTILTLIAIVGFGLRLYSPQKLDFSSILAILIGIIVTGIIVSYLRGKQKLLPDTFIDELSNENNYLASPCTLESLREADEMTKPYFGKGFIPSDRIEQWRLKNEKGFVQITNPVGQLCACFVIVGLERSFFDQFIAGRVTEHEIDSKVILSFEDTKKQDRIYISGVVVRDPGGFAGSKRTRVMIWAMLEYIKKFYGFRKTRTFYALGLTKESERLVQRMEFNICCDKESRRDNSNLYRIDITKEKWWELLRKIGDLSKMVSFHRF